MARIRGSTHYSLSGGMAEAYTMSERMNQLVLEHLNPRAWRAKPAGGKVRTIAGIFTHVHNIRRKWLRLSAPHLGLPRPLDRIRCTPQSAKAALAESGATCAQMLRDASTYPGKSIREFRRDGWAKPWPVGPGMFAYMLSHDAHHRGQACMLAGLVGFPLPEKVKAGLWNWERLRRECGFASPG
jgi:uncharacterized damage-inducible protein DinB